MLKWFRNGQKGYIFLHNLFVHTKILRCNKSLLMSAGSGLLAILVSFVYLHMKELSVTGGKTPVDVLVAVQDIEPGSMIDGRMIEIKKVPKVFVQPSAVGKIEDLAGRVTIAKILPGEQVLATKVIMAGKKSGLSYKVPSGYRAVSILFKDEKSVGGYVLPDDVVDIVLTSKNEAHSKSVLLLQKVQVLAVNNKSSSFRNPEVVPVVRRKEDPIFGSDYMDRSSNGKNNIITFALNPADAKKLIVADHSGTLSLLLREVGDMSIYEDRGDGFAELMFERQKDFKEYRGR